MNKSTFIKGATILSAAGIIVKLLGAVFKIPLANMIGDTGMAYFNPSYYIYALFLTPATAGIPTAISRLVSENVTLNNHREAHQVFVLSSRLMVGFGVVAFTIVFFGAEWFANLLKFPEIVISIRSIAPGLLIVPLMACYRGYFQGQHNMMPTGLSQIVEQGSRVTVGLLFAYLLYHQHLDYSLDYSPEALGAAGATFGNVGGAIGGIAVIILIYIVKGKDRRKLLNAGGSAVKPGSWKPVIKTIIYIAVPITIGATLLPLTNLIDAALVNRRLMAANFTPELAKSLYGQLTGFAGTITNLPLIFIQAIAVTIVPLVAASFKSRQQQMLQTQIILGIRVATLIALPCVAGLAILARPILLLLYPSQVESAISTVPCLIILALGILPLAVEQTMTGVLQGTGKQTIPVKNLAIGLLLKIVLTWVLVAVPFFNVTGAAIGTVIGYACAASLNTAAVIRHTGITLSVKDVFLRPLLPTGIMAVAAIGIYQLVMIGLGRNAVATLIAILIAVIIYGVMLIVTRTITREEIEQMPVPAKFSSIKEKIMRRL